MLLLILPCWSTRSDVELSTEQAFGKQTATASIAIPIVIVTSSSSSSSIHSKWQAGGAGVQQLWRCGCA